MYTLYKTEYGEYIVKLNDDGSISSSQLNGDKNPIVVEYEQWLAEGNEPEVVE